MGKRRKISPQRGINPTQDSGVPQIAELIEILEGKPVNESTRQTDNAAVRNLISLGIPPANIATIDEAYTTIQHDDKILLPNGEVVGDESEYTLLQLGNRAIHFLIHDKTRIHGVLCLSRVFGINSIEHNNIGYHYQNIPLQDANNLRIIREKLENSPHSRIRVPIVSDPFILNGHTAYTAEFMHGVEELAIAIVVMPTRRDIKFPYITYASPLSNLYPNYDSNKIIVLKQLTQLLEIYAELFWAMLGNNGYSNIPIIDYGAGDLMGKISTLGNIQNPTLITTNGRLKQFTLDGFVEFLYTNEWTLPFVHQGGSVAWGIYKLFGKFFKQKEIYEIIEKVKPIRKSRQYPSTLITRRDL